MAHGTHEVLLVHVAGQCLGLPGRIVRELLRAVEITPLPRAARFVEGVISIRGQVVPVLDLRQWLQLPARPLEPSDHLVVVESDTAMAVLRVDRALELARLADADDTPAGSVGGGSSARIVQHAGGLVVLPDLTPLLAQAKSFQESVVQVPADTEASS